MLFTNNYLKFLRTVYDEEDEDVDIGVSYGAVGDANSWKLVPPKYQDVLSLKPDASKDVDPNGCLNNWSITRLQAALISTGHQYLVKYAFPGEPGTCIKIITLSALISETSMEGGEPLLTFVDDQQQLALLALYIFDFEILRCLTFDRYIRAANTIKAAWYKHKQRKLNACVTIQRAVMRHLYRPDSGIVQTLKRRFELTAMS